jgi:small-conductance mechanosensitive channel
VLRDAVRSGLERANVEYANTVAQVAYGLVVVVVLSAAVGQLHFDIALLNRVVEIGLLAGAAAVAITLGLGSRELVNNILAGTYARELHHSGIRITVGDQSGTVVQVGTVATNLTTDDGDTVYLPNTMLLTEVVRISNGSAT